MTRLMMFMVLAALLLVPAMAQSTSPVDKNPTFSAVRDFSTTDNPNGVWSYGYTATLGSVFNFLPFGGGDCHVDFCGWGFGPTNLNFPNVLSNGYLKIIKTLELQPGVNGEYSILRWTAPTSGKFETVGVFVGDRDCTTTDVHVLYNSVPIFNDRIVCLFDPSLFHFRAKLNKGDIVDFAVGNDSTSNDDAAGLDVTITAIP
jgi:hypothetical protein